MTKNEFYEEVKTSEICPADFDEVYPEFAKYQTLALETLKAFHDVCETAGVRYQLGFGSLLGAIRDHGQIPWDYDVDVIVPFSDRQKLIEALKKYLPDDFYFYCPEVDRKCKLTFVRVTPKGYRSDRLHVDVFYVIGAPISETERYSFESEMGKLLRQRYVKMTRFRDFPRNAYKGMLTSIIQRIRNLNISINGIEKQFESICTQYDPIQTGITIPVLTAYKHLYWETSELWDTELYDTDLGTFRITKNYDKILNIIYKDYNKIYPLQSRLDEMYKSYYLLKYNKNIRNVKSVSRYYIKS